MENKKKSIRTTYYDKTDIQKKRYIYGVRSRIKKGDNELLKKMMETAEKELVRYHADFYVHDVSLIKENEGKPFLWVVREYGTHYIDLSIDEELSEDRARFPQTYFKSILHNYGNQIKTFYFNGKFMRKISIDQSKELLQKYVSETLRKIA